MAEFTGMMHPTMVGLTGTKDQTDAAARAYRAYAKKQDTGDEYYLMDHSTQTYLMLPGVGFVTFFKSTDSAETVAGGTACYLKAA
jgi:protein SCO1